jgi:hypothetical protein
LFELLKFLFLVLNREALAFATEPVFASLSNVLGNLSSISTVPKGLQEYQLYDVEIKHGLLQVGYCCPEAYRGWVGVDGFSLVNCDF